MSSILRIGFMVGFAVVVLLDVATTHAEELHNLEIIFKKSYDELADSVYVFGSDLSGVGDVNGDGYDDFAAAGWEYDLAWRSLVFVFLGGAALDTIPYLILRDGYWGGTPFGRLAGGDVNGDGFSDLVVGLPYGPGNVDIYFGGNPMDTIADLCFMENAPEWYFGCAVATGDINGDGYCDVVAADYMKDNRGAAYVYYGGPLLDNLPDIKLNGHGSEGFGVSVASGGDVDSDGYDDIVVGAWANGDLFYMGGAIYVYYGGDPMDALFDVRLYGEGDSHALGWQGVTLCRNQSAYDYVATGTPLWPYGFPIQGSGKLYTLFGGDPMDGVPDLLMYGKTDSSGLGQWTQSAGDVNGDGYGDLICGAMEDPFGVAYIWLGGASMDDVPDAWMRGDFIHTCVGFRVASAGDVDGDGRDEVMISNPVASPTWRSVWVCKYAGTGISEAHAHASSVPTRWQITCAPNPFRESTTIAITPGVSGHVHRGGEAYVSIRDASGRLVKDVRLMPGSSEVVWDGRDDEGASLPDGIYFVALKPDSHCPPFKLIHLK